MFESAMKNKPGILTAALTALLLTCGCKPPAPKPADATPKATYPARPTVAAPAVKIFHQDEDTYTLVTQGRRNG